MRKLLYVLLFTSSLTYAAPRNELVLSDTIISMGEQVVNLALENAQKLVQEPLSGTVYDFYLLLKNEGYRAYMANNPEAVAQALVFIAMLSDKTSENDAVKRSIEAFDNAQSMPQDVGQQKKLKAWLKELKEYSIAIVDLVKKEVSSEVNVHPSAAQRIALNNGKIFSEKDVVIMGGGLLAILAGFEKRRQAMGAELFEVMCNRGQFFNSPAHLAIASTAKK